MLPVASSTYYDNKRRPLSARGIRDAVMMPILLALWIANRKVHGAHNGYLGDIPPAEQEDL
jgi:hypothetical protein